MNIAPAGPFVLQANSHNSQVLRQLLQSQMPTPGIINAGDMLVSANGTPNMSVNVSSGFSVCPGTQSNPSQGSYHVFNDAMVNLAIAASDPTNPRWDLVCLSVRDSSYSGGNNDALLQVVTGTPAGSPALPATPPNSIPLAKVVVGATVNSITSGNLTDLRVQANAISSVRGAVTASVLTQESTTSTSFTNLATSGPAVTVTTGLQAKVTLYCNAFSDTDAFTSIMGFAVSGATTLAANDNQAIWISVPISSGGNNALSATFLVTGLTPGVNTFTSLFRVNGHTGTFINRRILVEP